MIMYDILNRFVALIFLILLFPMFLLISMIVKINSKGPIFHMSERIGLNNKIFLMPKFRTMKVDTPQIATHLIAGESANYLTSFGGLLRSTSLDELPQLLSIFVGDMYFVGPRPALFNQFDLIELRSLQGIDKLKPGITGWAQINGRDELSIEEKVKFDFEYKCNRNIALDLRIIFRTFINIVYKKGISH